MVAKASKRSPVDEVKPLTDERKNLIERYTVEGPEDGEPVGSVGEVEASAGRVEASAGELDGSSESAGEVAASAGSEATGSVGSAAEVEAPTSEAAGLVESPGEPDASTDEVETPAGTAGGSPPRSAGRTKTSPGTAGGSARRGATKTKASTGGSARRSPAKTKASSGGSARRGAAKAKPPSAEVEPSVHRSQTEAAEIIGNGAGSEAEAAEVSRLLGSAGDARSRSDEQTRLAPGVDEKRPAEEPPAQPVAEAEVRRLREELALLTAETEQMRAGLRRPQPDAAVEAERTVDVLRALKAVAAPIEVPPLEQTEVCSVVRWRGYLTCEFFACRPDDAIVATSGTFRWRKSAPPPEDDGPAREAFDRLVLALVANGWEECGRGALWYERRFERPTRLPASG